MIAFVRGRAEELTQSSVILDTGAIGYEIFMTSRDLSRIMAGDELLLYTYFQVREDAMQLFGFMTKDDLKVFRLLLGVSGVGPKAALGLLGAIPSDELRLAVLSDDVKLLSSAPGIGRKTAQKLILELKDKFDLTDVLNSKASSSGQEVLTSGAASPDERNEAVQALMALGYSRAEAGKAVQRVKDAADMEIEDILKAALKFL